MNAQNFLTDVDMELPRSVQQTEWLQLSNGEFEDSNSGIQAWRGSTEKDLRVLILNAGSAASRPTEISRTLSAMLTEGRNADPDTERLAEYISELNKLIAGYRFAQINQLLREVELDTISTPTMLALLRATFPVRSRLMDWSTLLEHVRVELGARGKNANRLLIGLG